jgi:hypothetical protein
MIHKTFVDPSFSRLFIDFLALASAGTALNEKYWLRV